MNEDHSTIPAPAPQGAISTTAQPPSVPGRTDPRVMMMLIGAGAVIVLATLAAVARPTVINVDHGGKVNYSPSTKVEVTPPGGQSER